MSESTQKKLSRVRKPRVHITYDVETGDAMEQRELPFVVGVLADLSGNLASAEGETPTQFRDRKFVEIDAGNFDGVLERMEPGVRVKVDDVRTISEAGGDDADQGGDTGDGGDTGEGDDAPSLTADLRFKSMADFGPAAIVEAVPQLKELLELRNRLRDLSSLADRVIPLEALLKEWLAEEGHATLTALKEEVKPPEATEE